MANATLRELRSSINELEKEELSDQLRAKERGCSILGIEDIDKKSMQEKILLTRQAVAVGSLQSSDSSKSKERKQELMDYYLAESDWLGKAQKLHSDIMKVKTELNEMRASKVDEYSNAINQIQNQIDSICDTASTETKNNIELEELTSKQWQLKGKLDKWTKLASKDQFVAFPLTRFV